ncbi:hypothetical protein BBJ28_00024506, partial [Nothophytophthora sp. Chile5]
ERLRRALLPCKPKTVLIVVNVLPLVFESNEASPSGWDVEWASSATAMFYRTLVSDDDKYTPLFIGCPEVFVAKKEEAALEKQLLKLRCVPVFLDPHVAQRYFQGFCKGVLWPIFHNIVDVYNSAKLQLDDVEEDSTKDAYSRRLFCQETGDTDNSAWCEPIAWNPAAQDKCWSDYCSVNRHFLTSCKRLLGLDYKTSPNGMLVIEYNGRKIHISCSHVEPDVTHLHEELNRNETDPTDAAQTLMMKIENVVRSSREPHKRKTVIGCVDRLEGLTAIPLKLRAFERFLATHPDKCDSVVLVQIGLTLDSRPNDYHRTRDYVMRFVNEINRRHAPPGEVVVYFEEKSKTTCAERVNLWRLCDVYFDTCVRGGLSLLPFEYIMAQHRNIQACRSTPGWSSPRSSSTVNEPGHCFGVMIVSEFAAYSRILGGSLLVNPWKTEDMVAALAKVVTMSYYEKHNRFYVNYKFLVGKADSIPWGERLLADVEAVAAKEMEAKAGETVQVGFGFDFRVMQFESGFENLNVDDLVRKCTKVSRRLFVLDYGGTLSTTASILDEEGAAFSQHNGGMERIPSNGDFGDRLDGGGGLGQDLIRYVDGQVRKPPSKETLANLSTLCADPCNIVFVTSNAQRAELEAQFGTIPHLSLVAENGLFLRKASGSDWECVCSDNELAFAWKGDVKRVMQAYAARTNGSFLVENEASLLYDYRNSDQEYGEIQSLELSAQLRKIIKQKGEATVNCAKGFVEVHQFGVSKAAAVSLVLKVLKQRVGVPEFVFVVGDDKSDDLVFE